MPQDIISIGLDTAKFTADQKIIFDSSVALFNELSKLESKTFSPALGGGLLEFNNSVKQTNALLAELNEKIGSLNAVANQNSTANTNAANSTSNNTKATKALTQEQAALKVQLQEANRAMIEQAKATNASVQARLAEKQAVKDAAKAKADAVKQEKQDAKDIAIAIKEEEKAKKQLEAATKIAAKEAAAESKATEKLISDYKLLKQAQQDQAANYANLFIAKGGKNGSNNSPEVKAALEEYKATSNVINNIDTQLLKAGKGAGNLGGALNGVWSQMRMLAYILPGLGIAGIFNLAGEAIMKAVEATGLLNNKLEEQDKRETEINNHLREQFGIYNDILAQKEKLYQYSEASSSSSMSRATDVFAAEGNNEVDVTEKRIADAKVKLDEALKKVNIKLDDPYRYETSVKEAQNLIEKQKQIEDNIRDIQKLIDSEDKGKFVTTVTEGPAGLGQTYARFDKRKEVNGVRLEGSDEDRKRQIEKIKSELELDKDKNKEILNNYQDYIESQNALDKLQAAQKKLLADEERKFYVETSKQNLDVKINEQSKIISSELSSFDVKSKAMSEKLRLEKAKNEKEFYNIEKNLSSTDRTIDVARNKRNTDNLNLQNKFNEDLAKLIEDQNQRYLKADTEIQKARINQSAVADERIFNNTEKSIEDRLKSFGDYITKRQQMQDLEEQKDIQKATIRAGGKIPEKEKDEIVAKADEQKANIQADAEKKVYDIVYSSLTKQLNAVKDANQAEDLESDKKYTAELKQLNDSFKSKKISYQTYAEERKKIDEKYRVQGLEAAIVDDKEDIQRLENKLVDFKSIREKLLKDRDDAKINLDEANSGGDKTKILDAKEKYDTAVGYVKALDTITTDVELAQFLKKKQLVADELALQKGKFEQEKKMSKELAQYKDQLVNASLTLIKTAVDAEYSRKLEMLSREKAIVDEQYGMQIDAIDKSSLSAKDKAALDIQLKEQQRQYDKNALNEERKLKHDQAVFDQKIAIAKITWSTAQAVAALILTPPLAIAAGALGAIQIATVLSSPIPSYAKGTENHPGGLARFGEAGPEFVKEPYKSPYLVMDETVSYLPKGTEVIPIKDSPVFGERLQDHSWEQTKWLAKQIRKSNTSITNKNIINIDLGYSNYKKSILGN